MPPQTLIQDILNKVISSVSNAFKVLDYAHDEIHEGNHFFVEYSVSSLGAMTTPDDTITLTFKTPDTTKWAHFSFEARGTSGMRVRLIEAPTGGAASPTGKLPIYNNNRNSANTSVLSAIDDTAGEVSYDATLATGGKTLIDEYMNGNVVGIPGASSSGSREEIPLKQGTTYQLSIFGTATDPATLKMSWYEHVNEDN